MGKKKNDEAGTSAISLVHPPSIYIGPRSAAASSSLLNGASITHVLSIGATPPSTVEGVEYLRISITDSPSSSIVKVCDAACDFIDNALRSKSGTGKVLVHCSAGISRSPAVVAAFLMKRCDMRLKAALGQIIHARPHVSPNPGFMQQLQELEMQLFGECSLTVDALPKREQDRLALFADERDAPSAAS